MTTEAGKRLRAEAPHWDYFGEGDPLSLTEHVAAIEAEAVAAAMSSLAAKIGTDIHEPGDECVCIAAVLDLIPQEVGMR